MSNQPIGWATAPLISLIAVDGLFTDGDWVESKDQDPNGDIRLLQLADIGDGLFLNKSARYINGEKFVELRCTELAPGDVLVARMPDPLGRACLMPHLPQRCVTVVDVAALRPGSQSVSPAWLMHTINAPQFRDAMAQQASGTTRKRISRGNLAELPIPVPPRQEQQRIADKLATVLARVDACRDRLARVAPLLKRFRQSVLAAATSGRLTEDWRDSAHSRSWRSTTIDAVCQSVADGDHQAPPQASSGIPFITIAAINDGRLSLQRATRCVPQPYFDSLADKRRPRRGDVLYSVTASLGIPAIVDTEAPFAFQRHIAILRPQHETISSEYLYYLLSSDQVRQQALAAATGTAQLTLALGSLRAIAIELPEPIEQAEIVRRVETLFAFADRMEARLAQAQTAVDRLTPSLLAKAFCGELVPQDPADEPAAELLKRLAAQREAAPARPRSQRATV